MENSPHLPPHPPRRHSDPRCSQLPQEPPGHTANATESPEELAQRATTWEAPSCCLGLRGFVKTRDRAGMGRPAWLPRAALRSQTLLLHALCGAERKHAAFNIFLAPGGQKKTLKVKMGEEELLPPPAGHSWRWVCCVTAAVHPKALQCSPTFINSYKSPPFLCPNCAEKAPLKILLQG